MIAQTGPERARERAKASPCQYFFLSLVDRYLFGLLRWTLGPESHGARRPIGARNSGKLIITRTPSRCLVYLDPTILDTFFVRAYSGRSAV